MSVLEEHYTEMSPEDTEAFEGRPVGWHVKPASAESVVTVLDADPQSPDGRSNWVWLRLPNGDLVLGLFPQGDTYFATELDHS
jgi:hypothetical protein